MFVELFVMICLLLNVYERIAKPYEVTIWCFSAHIYKGADYVHFFLVRRDLDFSMLRMHPEWVEHIAKATTYGAFFHIQLLLLPS